MIHQFTSIHPNAQIGNNVRIDPFTTIHDDVVIGNDCYIMSNVTILPGARIGNNCTIFPGAVIAAIPQDLKFQGEYTTVEIGNNTTIRECVTINRGTAAKMKTVVGDNCLLMAYAHVAHDVKIGNHCILVSHTGIAGEVELDDWVTLGGGSLIHQFVKVGAHAMIGGASRVTKDVPPYILAAREPLAYTGVNIVGLRRRGFSSEKIHEIQSIYTVLYQHNMNTSDAIAHIENAFEDTEERNLILSFVKGATRGIIKGYTTHDRS